MSRVAHDEFRELTNLLRSKEGPFWSRLRDLLSQRGIHPQRAVLAECFPDDNSFEFGIIVKEDGSVFSWFRVLQEGDIGWELLGVGGSLRDPVRLAPCATPLLPANGGSPAEPALDVFRHKFRRPERSSEDRTCDHPSSPIPLMVVRCAIDLGGGLRCHGDDSGPGGSARRSCL